MATQKPSLSDTVLGRNGNKIPQWFVKILIAALGFILTAGLVGLYAYAKDTSALASSNHVSIVQMQTHYEHTTDKLIYIVDELADIKAMLRSR